ncbi:DUF6538 domain-containing protein [Caballeronia novacaledonica]|uniref:Tyrosine-type recombinase/integrase n=1 Tax=Caballeronia novacaledonica TaxID=1544861 RepID=A0AA37I5J1_9BURK|nr:DUF6538 domain-containing protein [Caballeronia novacaledonica]GJH23706.1 tyrosine-type recombinase/integrase [Caballeronia novacaledonica]
MPLFHLSSIMAVHLKHTRKKGNLIYFRRRIPEDIQSLLAAAGSPLSGKSHVVVSLQTSDPRVAAPKIAKLVKQTDAEWEELRRPSRAGTLKQAHQLLTHAGIDVSDPTGSPEIALDVFYEYLDERLPDSVKEDETITTGKQLDQHFDPVHRAALQLLQNRREFTLADCLDQYAQARPKAAKTAKLAFGYLSAFLGSDRDIRNVRRSDVNAFVLHLLQGGHSEDGTPITTSTVGRYLNSLKAAFTRAINENELDIRQNVFAKVEIPNKGEDVQARESFTVPQLHALHAAIDKWVASKGWDPLRCILTVLAETGCRLAEVVGLAASDAHLHAAVPYIDIKPQVWRSLKTAASTRKVPLTARALSALREAQALSKGSAFLFPNYTNEQGCSADSVSAVLNKWIRSREGLRDSNLSNHCLRHTMKDLLRAVECLESIQDALLGHATPGIGASYGKGYPLPILQEWQQKAMDVAG